MVIYEAIGKNGLGVEMTRAYSDAGFQIERDGLYFEEAIDPTEKNREYTETNIPITTDEATASDYEQALEELGVKIDD